jgi:hypothetical protein
MIRQAWLAVITCTIVGFTSLPSAKATLIDDFTQSNTVPQIARGTFSAKTQTVTAGPFLTGNPSPPPLYDVVGGYRTLTVTNTNPGTNPNNPTFTGSVGAEADGIVNAYTYTQTGQAFGTGQLIYNGNGAGLGGVNLTANGASELSFGDFGTGGAGYVLTVTVTSTGGSSTYTSPSLPLTPTGSYEILFSQFTGNANFAAVNSITISANGTNVGSNQNITFDFLQSSAITPEPSGIALGLTGAIGLIGFGFRRSRASKKSA